MRGHARRSAFRHPLACSANCCIDPLNPPARAVSESRMTMPAFRLALTVRAVVLAAEIRKWSSRVIFRPVKRHVDNSDLPKVDALGR